jgi:hypothetical protein
MYYDSTNGQSYVSLAALSQARGIVIPAGDATEALAEHGIARTTHAPRPKTDRLQDAHVNATPDFQDGAWVFNWTVVDRTVSLAEARQIMVGWIDQLTTQILSQYPAAVRERWNVEEAAARAYLSGAADAIQTTLVEREAAAKQKAPALHAERIVEKADLYRGIADKINEMFLATTEALEAEADPSRYPSILRSAMGAASGLAGTYGLSMPEE